MRWIQMVACAGYVADPNGLSHENLKLLEESNSVVASKILENTCNDSRCECCEVLIFAFPHASSTCFTRESR